MLTLKSLEIIYKSRHARKFLRIAKMLFLHGFRALALAKRFGIDVKHNFFLFDSIIKYGFHHFMLHGC